MQINCVFMSFVNKIEKEKKDSWGERSRTYLRSGFVATHSNTSQTHQALRRLPFVPQKMYLLKHRLQNKNKRKPTTAARLQNILCTIKLIKKSLYTLQCIFFEKITAFAMHFIELMFYILLILLFLFLFFFLHIINIQ